MIICNQHRTTSQGGADCHQPEGHPGDHLAYLDDIDGDLWLASWSSNYPNHVDLTPIRRQDIMANFYDCDQCGQRLHLKDLQDHYQDHEQRQTAAPAVLNRAGHDLWLGGYDGSPAGSDPVEDLT